MTSALANLRAARGIMLKHLLATVFVGLLLATSVVMTAQEEPAQSVDPGRSLFMTYCASCHGITGRGNGPSADEFRRRPADLTQCAKKNGGVFNNALIHRSIDGRSIKAHGNLEMPVWGDAFKWRLGLDEDAVRQRIEALVRYVESIQERAGH
ncbi:MAG: cytochrome c [Acidobacteriota bacterium]